MWLEPVGGRKAPVSGAFSVFQLDVTLQLLPSSFPSPIEMQGG